MKYKMLLSYTTMTPTNMLLFDFLLLQSDWLSVFFPENIPNMNDWPLIDVVSFPQQDEGSLDCRVFLMKVIEHIALDNKINFNKEDMSKFRSHCSQNFKSFEDPELH